MQTIYCEPVKDADLLTRVADEVARSPQLPELLELREPRDALLEEGS
jgi:hypothetical protein